MKTTLQRLPHVIGQSEDDNPIITLNDENFNVPGWVEISINSVKADVPIDELYHAVCGLYYKYRTNLELEREN